MRKLWILCIALVLMALPFAGLCEAEPTVGLLSLKVEENTRFAKLEPEFDPAVLSYTYNVQSDIMGVRFTPEVAEGLTVSVNGTELAAGDRYICELSQEEADYAPELHTPVTIAVSDGSTTVEYTVEIVREGGQYLYDQFTVGLYHDDAADADMDYLLHIPADYDPNKSYPLVFALHGGGQSTQPVEYIMYRYQLATTWVKYGYDCIVLAPHNMKLNAEDKKFSSAWGTTDENGKLCTGEAGNVAYNLLQKIKSEYSVDENRVYVTGMSMGGIGSLAMVVTHPEEWAAAMISCFNGLGDEARIANTFKEYGIPVWLCHEVDDPVMPFTNFTTLIDAMNAAGFYDYRVTVYPEDTAFYPTGHYIEKPVYADPVHLDWLMSQVKK